MVHLLEKAHGEAVRVVMTAPPAFGHAMVDRAL
jgi:hypothetical protein